MSVKKKPYYSLEFKQDAASLVLRKGYSVEQASASLGVSISALRRWIKAERGYPEEGTTNVAKTSISLSEYEELLKLRKENMRLRMEREILKKASAFFAQEMK